MSNKLIYDAILHPLSKEEGGGYMVSFPDLPGCYADGATPEEAFHEAEDALKSWIQMAKEHNDPVPCPKTSFSGQTRLRLPKSLHADLSVRAKYEGVSFNTFVISLLAEAIGQAKKSPTRFVSSHRKTAGILCE